MALLRVLTGTRPGRGHRRRGAPCQDAVAAWSDPALPRAVAAVADGLGSCPLSEHGSQAAVAAAVSHLAGLAAWDQAALVEAFAVARAAVEAKAAELHAPLADLATTLQVVAVDHEAVLAAMVGDGAVVAGEPPQALLAPQPGGYANEVVPLTAAAWRANLQQASLQGPVPAAPVAVFSDGLTRLLLERPDGAWRPFTPFFQSFFPAAATGDAAFVQRFLDGDDVDRSWDDDKGLAVLHARR